MDGKETHTLEPVGVVVRGKRWRRGKGVFLKFRLQVEQVPGHCGALTPTPGARGGGDQGKGRARSPARLLEAPPVFWRPPPQFGKPWGGVCLLPARTAGQANPWGASPCVTHVAGQSAHSVLLRRQSLRGGSGAGSLSGEGDEVGGGLGCRRRCLAPGRALRISLGRLEGVRAASQLLEVPGLDRAGPGSLGVSAPGLAAALCERWRSSGD